MYHSDLIDVIQFVCKKIKKYHEPEIIFVHLSANRKRSYYGKI